MGIRWMLAAVAAMGVAAGEDGWESRWEQCRVAERSGRFVEAAACYGHAAGDARDDRARRLQAWNALARVQAELGAYPEAVQAYEAALRAAAPSSVDTAVLMGSLATLHIEFGRTAKGERLLREATTRLEGMVAPGDVRLARLYNDLAELLVEERRFNEAEPLLEQALAALALHPEEGRLLGFVHNNLGLLRRAQGRTAEAAMEFERSVAAIESELGVGHGSTARVWNNLATAYVELKRCREAEAAFEGALRIAELRFGQQHPTYAALLRNYASFLKRSGRKGEGKALEARSDALLREHNLRTGRGSTVDVASFTRPPVR